jgi:hypothetical protein
VQPPIAGKSCAVWEAFVSLRTICCIKSSLTPDLRFHLPNLFDCAALQSFCGRAGAQRIGTMIETVTAVMALVSAGIFLAHAFEGYRYRA